ncbi:hypothetical protein BJ085DRAFT_30829 [Dimargaris cristalligena]|uniref:Uncharacterized protein n=1 Tax=Dimargaris cristalligena TaxID=215637 RepID=A0A4Q0A1E9_9FUNG|nr:hypothetical protein BJ085DRAFT_30829 [Dimargaris cristalligena]|eukprot:RKP39598.1 hypothetical protein BJ085DRAFT_30829 [Dimargaris cristalligena]
MRLSTIVLALAAHLHSAINTCGASPNETTGPGELSKRSSSFTGTLDYRTSSIYNSESSPFVKVEKRQSRLEPSYDYCLEQYPYGFDNADDECASDVQKYYQLLTLNEGNEFLANDRRVAINLSFLNEQSFRAVFPMVADMTVRQLEVLWNKVVVDSIRPVSTSLTMVDGPNPVNLEPVADILELDKLLPYVAMRVMMAGVWYLYYQGGNQEGICKFFRKAADRIAQLSDGKRSSVLVGPLRQLVYMTVTIAAINEDLTMVDQMRPILDIQLGKATGFGSECLATRPVLLATMEREGMDLALSNLDIMWPASENDEVEAEPWNIHPFYTQVFRLTDEGDLVQIVPLAWFANQRILQYAEVLPPPAGELGYYNNAKHIEHFESRLTPQNMKLALESDPEMGKSQSESVANSTQSRKKKLSQYFRRIFRISK